LLCCRVLHVQRTTPKSLRANPRTFYGIFIKVALSYQSTWLHLYFLEFHVTNCSDWTFFSGPDPTNGNVNYQTKEAAIQQKLVVVENGRAILAVDDSSKVAVGGNRNS
jgi:hypothetical protein